MVTLTAAAAPSSGVTPRRLRGPLARLAVWWLDGMAYHGAAIAGLPCTEVHPPTAAGLRALAGLAVGGGVGAHPAASVPLTGVFRAR